MNRNKDEEYDQLRLREHRAGLAAKWNRVLQNCIIILSGVAVLIFPPSSAELVIGFRLSIIWGVLLIIGGTLAAYGVASDNVYVEIPATWVIAAGLAFYIVGSWSIAIGGAPARISGAFVSLAFLSAYLSRSFELIYRLSSTALRSWFLEKGDE